MSRLPIYPNPQTPAHWRAVIHAIDFDIGLVEGDVVILQGQVFVLQGQVLVLQGDVVELQSVVFFDTGTTAGAVTAGQAVYSSGAGTFALARGNTLASSRVVGFVRTTTGGPGVVEIQSVGIIPVTGVVAGQRYFLSAVTAGLIVSTPDAVAGQFLVPIGFGLTTDRLLFVPHTPILI